MCLSRFLGIALFVLVVMMADVYGTPTASLFLDTFEDYDADPMNDAWEMTATVTSGTDGLFEFAIGIIGSHYAELDAPRILRDGGVFPHERLVGFTIYQLPNGTFSGDGELSGAQDTEFGPAGTIFYQVGVEAGGTPAPAPFDNINVPWDHPVLLGHGTGDWQTVDFDPAIFPTIGVFADGAAETDSREVEAIDPSNITLVVTRHPIPEPTAATLLAFCMTALALRRLRQ